MGFGQGQRVAAGALAAVGVAQREPGTLTFGNDMQDDVEGDEGSDHEQKGHRVHDGELDGPVAVVEEPDDQGHEAGLRPVDEQGLQVSKVVGNLTT